MGLLEELEVSVNSLTEAVAHIPETVNVVFQDDVARSLFRIANAMEDIASKVKSL